MQRLHFIVVILACKDSSHLKWGISRHSRLKMAGVKSSLHILRHTNITTLITNGTDIKTVKNRAGHTRIETTMSYTHPSEDLDRKAANIFEKFF